MGHPRCNTVLYFDHSEIHGPTLGSPTALQARRKTPQLRGQPVVRPMAWGHRGSEMRCRSAEIQLWFRFGCEALRWLWGRLRSSAGQRSCGEPIWLTGEACRLLRFSTVSDDVHFSAVHGFSASPQRRTTFLSWTPQVVFRGARRWRSWAKEEMES
ncbi:hypothetical protein NDU88_008523 [Pleurodeles waltl]|uniref:Uncharacterized protein n=1 Tax=Pleurodeles waltl TaxID=8319 RepID=A0AAV7PPD5_PLEWA|nr:hypothetical protein NDU88_008523 [Pleurodeles waltl]